MRQSAASSGLSSENSHTNEDLSVWVANIVNWKAVNRSRRQRYQLSSYLWSDKRKSIISSYLERPLKWVKALLALNKLIAAATASVSAATAAAERNGCSSGTAESSGFLFSSGMFPKLELRVKFLRYRENASVTNHQLVWQIFHQNIFPRLRLHNLFAAKPRLLNKRSSNNSSFLGCNSRKRKRRLLSFFFALYSLNGCFVLAFTFKTHFQHRRAQRMFYFNLLICTWIW